MKKVIRRILSVTLVVALLISGSFMVSQLSKPIAAEAANNTWVGKAPKYIFLFVGDGMSYAQFASASDYLGTLEHEGKAVQSENLSFMNFPVAGSATTFDSTSFCPDSASTATSLSTGYKTLSGVLNMDEKKEIKYETISEKLKKQLGYKIGIVSSVSIDHATPAAFYAHQPSRGNYYDIGVELVNSGFDYFGGGGFIQPKGKDGDKQDLFELAKAKGYSVANTKNDILALSADNKKVIAINPELDNSQALPYDMDRASGTLSLADFTRKGIDVLFNETGFFMMVEGGKIDWACHANDAMASIDDTIAFDKAVQEAVNFYEKYPDDTLIIVTGDHETGGLTIGYSATGYSTYLDILSEQSMSYYAFDATIANYRKNKTDFATALKDIKANFGLVAKKNSDANTNAKLVLTDYEYSKLEEAYKVSMIDSKERKLNDEEKVLYGSYEPLSVTLTHILNNKAGIGWTSYSHTGVPVAVFAKGLGENAFNGYYDNTDINIKLQSITKVK